MTASLRVRAFTDASGPIFDGRFDDELKIWARDTEDAIAAEGVRLLREFPMNKTLRASGGFQREVRAIRQVQHVIIPAPTDKGVTWGPWLEGVSKRNESTRFKGYRLFRKTRQELNRKAAEIGQREMDKVIGAMGGVPYG